MSKQVKVNDILYVMDTEAYAITADTDARIIYVPEDYYDDYVEVNSGLTLTKYNYGVIRVTTPEYAVEPEPPEPPTPTVETKLVVTYTIDDISAPSQIYSIGNSFVGYNLGATDFTSAEIDGTEVSISDLDTNQGTYQFSATGTHTVKYELKENAVSDYRFYDQDNYVAPITTIYIPSGLTSIGANVFDDMYGTIETIVVDDENTAYTSNGVSGNCIVEKDTNTLIAVSNNTVIPDGTEAIADNVGVYNQGIQDIIIPNSVTTIGENCFSSCGALKTVVFGSGIESVGSGSFCDCEYFSTATIIGTEDMTEILPYNMWSYVTTLYVDSSMISTYQEYLSDDFGIEVLPIA